MSCDRTLDERLPAYVRRSRCARGRRNCMPRERRVRTCGPTSTSRGAPTSPTGRSMRATRCSSRARRRSTSRTGLAVGACRGGRALAGTRLYERATDERLTRRYATLIETHAQINGLDPALVKAVIAVESAFDPRALSAKGAVGLMQVIPDTGERYGLTVTRDDRSRRNCSIRRRTCASARATCAISSTGSRTVCRWRSPPTTPAKAAWRLTTIACRRSRKRATTSGSSSRCTRCIVRCRQHRGRRCD